MLFYQLVNARLNGSFLEPRADAVVRHAACTQWEIVLRLNDRKMSMDKNVKRGLPGRVILPDVVWHVFSVVSGGYNKVTGGGGQLYSPTSSSSIRLVPVADISDVVFLNNCSCSFLSEQNLCSAAPLSGDSIWTVTVE